MLFLGLFTQLLIMKYSITTEKLPQAFELLPLFSQTTWAKDRSAEGIALLLNKTETYVVIRDNDQLIGFGRALTDGIYRALLDDIIVHEKYRKQGIGKLIVNKLLDQLKDVEQIFLTTKPELESFYKPYGFSKSKGLTMSL